MEIDRDFMRSFYYKLNENERASNLLLRFYLLNYYIEDVFQNVF